MGRDSFSPRSRNLPCTNSLYSSTASGGGCPTVKRLTKSRSTCESGGRYPTPPAGVESLAVGIGDGVVDDIDGGAGVVVKVVVGDGGLVVGCGA